MALQSDPSRAALRQAVRFALLDDEPTIAGHDPQRLRRTANHLETSGVIGTPLQSGNPGLWHLCGLRRLLTVDDRFLAGDLERLTFHARALLRLDDPSTPTWKARVSVVIPVFDRAEMVGEAIESALDQRGPSVEVIVVDDGSSDDIDAALAPFRNRILLLRQSNQGVAAARNLGLSIATGDYLHFLDSDNQVEPGFYEASINALEAIPDAGICYAAPRYSDREASGSFSGGFLRLVETYNQVAKDQPLHGASNCPATDLMAVVAERHPFLMVGAIVPRWLVESIGRFDSRLRRGEDTLLWFEMGLRGIKVIGLKPPMNRRRRLSQGLSATKSRQNMAATEWLRLLSLLAAPAQWQHAFTVIGALRYPAVWPGESPGQEPCLTSVTLQVRKRLQDLSTTEEIQTSHHQVLWLALQQLTATVTSELESQQARSLAAELQRIACGAWPLQTRRDSSDTRRLRLILTVMAQANWWSCASPGRWFHERLNGIPPSAVGGDRPSSRDVVGAPCAFDANRWHGRALTEVLGRPPSKAVLARIAYHAAWILASLPGSPSADHLPLVSVVIPVHDRVALAAEAVASALGQTYPGIEVIVVDDGSSEDLRQALGAFLPRLRLLRQPNGGPAQARNLGISVARGQLIHFLDADDLLDADAVARKVEALRAVPDAELVYSGLSQSGECAHEIGQPCRYRQEPEDEEGSPTRDLLAAAAVRYPFQTSTVMLPLWILLEEEGFDHRLQWGEDGHLFFRLGLRGTKCIGIRGRTTHRRIGEGNLTSVQPTSRQWALSKGLRLLTLLERGNLQQIDRFGVDTFGMLMQPEALISLSREKEPLLDGLREDLLRVLRSRLPTGLRDLPSRLIQMLEERQAASPALRNEPYLRRLRDSILPSHP